MGNVSRPLIGLLIATVVFFALWLIALKPGSSSTSGAGNQGLGAYQPAINAARNVGKTVTNASAAAAGQPPPTGTTHSATQPSSTSASTATAKATRTAKPAHRTRAAIENTSPAGRHAAQSSAPATPAARLKVVSRALTEHKVLALLFYNPSAADDNAVKSELASISTHRGAVVKLEIPLSELPSYTVVISQVPVNFSPTLVIIDRAQQAQEITGFSGSYEIEQRLEQALASGTRVA